MKLSILSLIPAASASKFYFGHGYKMAEDRTELVSYNGLSDHSKLYKGTSIF